MISYFPVVTGSLVVLGNVSVSGSINTSGSITISGSITSASFASTASSADNFLTRGTLTAQTLVVQTITSSVDFVTGSTRFGSILSNTHVFSGSVTMNPGGLFVSSSGNVGIGTTSPSFKLDVTGTARIWDGTQGFNIRAFTAGAGYGAIYSTGVTPSNINYALVSNGASTYLNATNDAGMTIDNGTKGIFLVSSGNVGIGTSSPTGRLMLYQSTAGNVLLNITSPQGGSTQAGINFSPSMTDGELASNPAQASIYATDSNFGANIIFANKATGAVGNALTERMRITSGGEVQFASSVNLGTNQRLKLSGGAGNLKGSAQANISSTTVTVFEGYELGGVPSGNLVIINGVKTGTGWCFTDLVNYMTNGTVTVFSSSTVGSPPARTYTVSGTNLRLSIAGGDTGFCSATGLTQGYQA